MTPRDEVQVRHEPEQSRWAAYVDGEEAGFAEYELREAPHVIAFTHTVVHEAFEGRGVAGTLVRTALEAVRAGDVDGRRVVAECSYVRGWLDKHPEFADLQSTL